MLHFFNTQLVCSRLRLRFALSNLSKTGLAMNQRLEVILNLIIITACVGIVIWSMLDSAAIGRQISSPPVVSFRQESLKN